MALSNRNNLGSGGGVSPSGEHVEVNADGVKNLSTLIGELYALIDFTKITHNSSLVREQGVDKLCYQVTLISTNRVEFTQGSGGSNNGWSIRGIVIATGTYHAYQLVMASTNSYATEDSIVMTAGSKLTLYY